MARIEQLKAILADRKVLLGVIRREILTVSEKYGDDRRTSIGFDEYDLSMEDLIPRENTVITMTKLGYIKRMTVDNFRSQNRGGKGIKGMQTIEDDYIEELLMTTTHHYLMFFTNTGRVYRLKAYEFRRRPEPQEERRLSTFSSCSRERRLPLLFQCANMRRAIICLWQRKRDW